jgi:selenide,water dikinase
MKALNRPAADALRLRTPNAVTDVTGFGLFGHAVEVAERSGVCVVLEAGRLPALPGALEAAGASLRTGGDSRNREFAAGRLVAKAIPSELDLLGFDPQTSGGLLFSLPGEQAVVLEAEFAARDLFIARIGRVEAGSGVRVAA